MTTIEIIAFGVLWVVLALLTALVALLYRQVERAYRRSAALQAAGLLPGNEAPDLEVLTADGVGPLVLPTGDAITVAAFVTPDCAACKSLVADLREGFDGVDRIVILVNGETNSDLKEALGSLEVYWLAFPGDAVRHYGVTVVPLVYVLKGRTIISSGAVSRGPEVAALVDGGLEFEADRAVAEATPAGAVP